MSMLLEALKKAALEKKDRLKQKAAFTHIAEARHADLDPAAQTMLIHNTLNLDENPEEELTGKISSGPTLEGEDQVQTKAGLNKVSAHNQEEAQPPIEVNEHEPPEQDTPILDLSDEIDLSQVDLQIEAEAQWQELIANEKRQSVENSADESPNETICDVSDNTQDNTHIDTPDETLNKLPVDIQKNGSGNSPLENNDDLVESIIADALAQTEEKTQDPCVDAQRNADHTKQAFSKLIAQSKKREKIHKHRLALVFSSFSIVSATLAGLYYYFLNTHESDFLVAPYVGGGINSRGPTETERAPPTEDSDTFEGLEIRPDSSPSFTDQKRVANNPSKALSPLEEKERPDLPTNAKPTGNSRPKLTAKRVKKASAPPANIVRIEPFQEHVLSAYKSYMNRNYSESLSLYHKAYALAPENTDTLLGLAACSIKLNKAEDALLYYTQILNDNPKEKTALAGLLSITSAQSSQPELESRLLNLIIENPNNAHLHFLMGNVYLAQQNWNGANSKLNVAASLEPRNADYLYNLAISYDQLSQYQHALKYYELAYTHAQGSQASFSLEHLKTRIRALTNKPREKVG